MIVINSGSAATLVQLMLAWLCVAGLEQTKV